MAGEASRKVRQLSKPLEEVKRDQEQALLYGLYERPAGLAERRWRRWREGLIGGGGGR